MVKLLENRHLVDKITKLAALVVSLIFLGFIFWKAPDNASQLVTISAYVLAGAKLKDKFSL